MVKRHYRKSVPMLIQKHLQPTIETKQYACLLAFTNGFANKQHYDTLLLEMNLLLVAGQTDKNKRYAIDFAMKDIKPALQGIKNRIVNTGKFGVNSEELAAIKRLIEFSREFWNKQTEQLYSFCIEQINLFYQEMDKQK